jgi:hypothetical protein
LSDEVICSVSSPIRSSTFILPKWQWPKSRKTLPIEVKKRLEPLDARPFNRKTVPTRPTRAWQRAPQSRGGVPLTRSRAHSCDKLPCASHIKCALAPSGPSLAPLAAAPPLPAVLGFAGAAVHGAAAAAAAVLAACRICCSCSCCLLLVPLAAPSSKPGPVQGPLQARASPS